MFRTLDLFAGIGGFSLGLKRTGGFETVGFCEIDPYAQAILRKNWTGVPVYPDVTNLEAKDVGPVQVICGGFPCQDISSAGKGAGLDGQRSRLWWDFARLIGEFRPEWVIIENVSVLRTRGLDRVLWSLAEIGYDAEWHCIPATYVGANHSRDRIWIIAYPQRDEQPWEEPRCWPFGRVGWIEQPVPWDTHWETALSEIRRVDDGLPRSVHRTDCLRNAIVPQIATEIGYEILRAHTQTP